jgi:hypothetical protein
MKENSDKQWEMAELAATDKRGRTYGWRGGTGTANIPEVSSRFNILTARWRELHG